MNRKVLASLSITGVLLSSASPVAFAVDPVQVPGNYTELLSVGKGDHVPAQYARPELAFPGWKAARLPQPDSGSQWVQIGDNFVLIKRSNAVIQDIQPIPK